MFMLFFNYNAR